MIKRFSRIVVRDGYRYLVIHNIKEGRNRWEFPGGKCEGLENSVDAGLRELREEVDLFVRKSASIQFIDDVVLDIDGGTWSGKFWLVDYDSTSGHPRIAKPEKFDGIRWVNASEYSRLPQIPILGVDIIRKVECSI